jgi:hypothetical protein
MLDDIGNSPVTLRQIGALFQRDEAAASCDAGSGNAYDVLPWEPDAASVLEVRCQARERLQFQGHRKSEKEGVMDALYLPRSICRPADDVLA